MRTMLIGLAVVLAVGMAAPGCGGGMPGGGGGGPDAQALEGAYKGTLEQKSIRCSGGTDHTDSFPSTLTVKDGVLYSQGWTCKPLNLVVDGNEGDIQADTCPALDVGGGYTRDENITSGRVRVTSTGSLDVFMSSIWKLRQDSLSVQECTTTYNGVLLRMRAP